MIRKADSPWFRGGLRLESHGADARHAYDPETFFDILDNKMMNDYLF